MQHKTNSFVFVVSSISEQYVKHFGQYVIATIDLIKSKLDQRFTMKIKE